MSAPAGFPARLLRLRADAGMTQKDLAKASGMSVPQIARYETGTSKPRMTALVKLAKALNVEVSDIQASEDEPETIELQLQNIDTGESTPFALPKYMVEELEQEADSRDVSLEVILVSTIKLALNKNKGVTKSFDEVVAEVAEEHSKFPPE
ncbi:helix-turn-helix domain-containing protein [Pseudomonas lini]|nr:helix-turn-helix transcriptional regulator [Pseudomonas lini]SDT22671.1 Helix-turn-helix [Pseudomonas lini]